MLRPRYITLTSVVFLMTFGLALGTSLRAVAQDSYPSKPVRMVVTTAAGGALDLVARTVAERLSESMGPPLIIENLPAGNGSIAAGQVAKANPDGYTIMMSVDSTLTVNPHLYKNLPYDPFRTSRRSALSPNCRSFS